MGKRERLEDGKRGHLCSKNELEDGKHGHLCSKNELSCGRVQLHQFIIGRLTAE